MHMYCTTISVASVSTNKTALIKVALKYLWTKTAIINVFKTFYYTMFEVVMKEGLENLNGPTGTLLDSTMLFYSSLLF